MNSKTFIFVALILGVLGILIGLADRHSSPGLMGAILFAGGTIALAIRERSNE